MQIAATELDGVHGEKFTVCVMRLLMNGYDLPAVSGVTRLLLQTQHPTLHFASGGHGQGVYKLNFFGVLVRGQLAFHMGLQFYRELGMKLGYSTRITCASRYKIRSNHHVGLDQCAALGVGLGHHRGVDDAGCLTRQFSISPGPMR